MAIYDCFQYFNEDHIVELRLNILDQFVDYFVISESTKTHQGKNKKLNFDIKKFSKFEKKIIYLVADYKEEVNFDVHTGEVAYRTASKKFSNKWFKGRFSRRLDSII